MIQSESFSVLNQKVRKLKKSILKYITKPVGVSGYELAKNKRRISKELKALEDLGRII